ncbi:MAG: FHA domain-containing protein [Rhodanobacteraceae bacterium]
MDEMSAAVATNTASTVWIEVLSRTHDVIARHRFADAPITIGRAYDNDVVVDDAHVAAHHVRIVHEADGTLAAEDLGSRNGMFLDRDPERRLRVVLDGERALRIGNTLIRVRTAAHAVPAEQMLLRSPHYWLLAIGCFVGVFALAVLELWLSETTEVKAIRYFTPLLILLLVVGIWIAAWSVLTRVFTGHARFGLHFLIVSAGMLAYSVYDQAAEIGAFALSWTSLATTSYVVAWILFGAMCLAHLLAVARTRLPLKFAIVAVLVTAGIAMQTLKQNEYRSTYGQPVVLRRLEPPAVRLVTPQREAVFFTDSTALREGLDKARTEEPIGSDGLDLGDDD